MEVDERSLAHRITKAATHLGADAEALQLAGTALENIAGELSGQASEPEVRQAAADVQAVALQIVMTLLGIIEKRGELSAFAEVRRMGGGR